MIDGVRGDHDGGTWCQGIARAATRELRDKVFVKQVRIVAPVRIDRALIPVMVSVGDQGVAANRVTVEVHGLGAVVIHLEKPAEPIAADTGGNGVIKRPLAQQQAAPEAHRDGAAPWHRPRG